MTILNVASVQKQPCVAVLMATYNGEKWLEEQIESILAQQSVKVSLYLYDDMSEDDTKTTIDELVSQNNNIQVLNTTSRQGQAGKSFYQLIGHLDAYQYDYIAFSDQDDIWLSDKLNRHIKIAEKYGADGVSSNVIAFWPDGKEKIIDKAQSQRRFDYLFESAGPGCTFLMTPWLVSSVREQLLNENSPAKHVALHDWLTYAVCRAHGRKWVIYPTPSVRYRQHSSNVVGANVGVRAKWVRIKRLWHGWYRGEVLKISKICNSIQPNTQVDTLISLLESRSIVSRFRLLKFIPHARRSLHDRILLWFSVLLGLF